MTLPKYVPMMKKCQRVDYDEAEQDTSDMKRLPNQPKNLGWDVFTPLMESKIRFTGPQEFYYGQFGNYWPGSGYIMDLPPYDMTLDEFNRKIDEMERFEYIKIGQTKAVDIDINLAVPSTNYFVSINMLFEFTPLGQIIPTRLDALPYKLSPFAAYKEDVTSILDWIKVMLNFYNMYVIVAWFKFIKQNKAEQ